MTINVDLSRSPCSSLRFCCMFFTISPEGIHIKIVRSSRWIDSFIIIWQPPFPLVIFHCSEDFPLSWYIFRILFTYRCQVFYCGNLQVMYCLISLSYFLLSQIQSIFCIFILYLAIFINTFIDLLNYHW